MNPIDRVALIGLGLIGGSLARALAARDLHVMGYDSAPDSLDAADALTRVAASMTRDEAQPERVPQGFTPTQETLARRRAWRRI